MSTARKDLFFGILLLVFAISFYGLTYTITSGYQLEEKSTDVGPAFVPRLVLGVMGLGSIILILNSLLIVLKHNKTVDKITKGLHKEPMIMFGVFLVYIYLATFLGYVISTICFMVASFYILGLRNKILLLCLPPLITFGIYFLFEKLLNIWLPSGSISFFD